MITRISDVSQSEFASIPDVNESDANTLPYYARFKGARGVRPISRNIAATERARWLAELAEAIDEAQRLAWRIGFIDRINQEAMDLYVRLEVVRAEVESITGSGWAFGPLNVSPKRSDLLPEDEL